jgi:hypothetical protein
LREIPLTRGKVAIVDDADHGWLSAFKWHCTSDGYASRTASLRENGRVVRRWSEHMAVAIMGRRLGMQVDHANGDTLDNRRSNLRHATLSQNRANRRRRRKFSSEYKGVHRHGDRWTAVIVHNGVHFHLGRFKCQEEAAAVYAKAAREKFGEFACTDV